MKKRLLLVLLTGLLAVPQVLAASYDYDFSAVCESGQTLYYKIKGDNVTVVDVYSIFYIPTGDLVIPSIVTYNNKTYSVTGLGTSAFSGCRQLTSVIIPSSVTSIGEKAFSSCSLTKITVEKGNVVFDSRDDCNAVVETKTNTLIIGCKNTIIPNSVTKIGADAFYGCYGLTTIKIPNSVTEIGADAFYGCYGLTTINIPNSVTEIGADAFYGCSLTKITVEKENVVFDSRDDCNAIVESKTNTLIIGCRNTIIPNSVTKIGERAFYSCDDLTTINIPNSVTEIGDYAFGACWALYSVVIPKSVKKIGRKAFEAYITMGGLAYMQKISYTGTIADWCEIQFEDETSNPIHRSKSFFLNDGEVTDLVIPNGTDTIKSHTFPNCSLFKSIKIPNSVKVIENSAFKNAGELYKITVDNANTVYDSRDNCNAIIETATNKLIFGCANTIIPNSVTEIGDYAFYYCTGLTSVNIPNSVTEIGDYAFCGCSNLSEAYLSIFTRYSSASFPSTTKLISNDLSASVNTCSATFKIQTSGRTEQFKEYGLIFDGKLYKSNADNIVTIQNLQSNKSYVVIAYHIDNNDTTMIHSLPFEFATKSLSPSATAIETKPTSLVLNGSYYKGDAELIGEEFIFNETIYKSNNAIITGLVPDTEYTVTYRVNTTTGSEETTQTFRTAKDLILKTLNPKVSEGKVVVCAETNMSDYETNVGFEWRKYDAPSSLPSKSGKAFLYNGSMKGTIKNLATDSYWNVRAYYTANDGTSYYGDWVTFDPGDFSWFEPEVHTYPATIVPNQPPQLRGYAVEGSDDVEEQGFEYWTIPMQKSTGEVKRIPATGTVMQATITDYEYSTEYICRSYVKTSTKTFYGEEQTFTTPEDPRPLYTFIVQAGENGRVNEEVNGQYREGESVEITATPDGGFRFAGWSDLKTENPRIVVVTSDTTIVASFEKIEDSVLDLLAEPDKSDVQVSDILGRQYKIANWNNLKGELRRGVYILFKGKESQKILVE